MGTVEPIEFLARREALGLSQIALGELLGVKQAAIAHWERGARPIPPNIPVGIEELEATQDDLIADLADSAATTGKITLPSGDLPLGFQRVAAAQALRDLRGTGRKVVISTVK